MKKLTLKEFQEKINIAHPKEKLLALNYNGDDCNCDVKCLFCQTVYTKKAGYFKDKRRVSICKICFPTQPNIKKVNYIPPEGYELVSEYKGMQTKVLVRHKVCGFIWSVKPNNLEFGKGCPICNRKVSKGEQKIASWLEANHFDYISQFPLSINGHPLTIDFYIPILDLYIQNIMENSIILQQPFWWRAKI